MMHFVYDPVIKHMISFTELHRYIYIDLAQHYWLAYMHVVINHLLHLTFAKKQKAK